MPYWFPPYLVLFIIWKLRLEIVQKISYNKFWIYVIYALSLSLVV
nr:MAG TPA: hypothetical protein [Caudoviricetes sp.]